MGSTTYPSLEPEQIGQAIRAFMAENCPACGVRKDLTKNPFCDKCLGLLTAELREKICDKNHFIEVFHPAMKYLKEHSGRTAPKRNRLVNVRGRAESNTA